MAEPYEDPRFYNAVEYTVAVTFTVRGGKRHGTADRQAQKIAERLASNAARMVGVVEVHATAGPSRDGEVTSPRVVHFDTANTGHGAFGEPYRIDRYLDPDHELALRSLAEANAACRARQQADRQRRVEVSCRNPTDSALRDAYCPPPARPRAANRTPPVAAAPTRPAAPATPGAART